MGVMPNHTEIAESSNEERNWGPFLPKDCQDAIDFSALTWLTKYEITMQEVVHYKMQWSPSRRMLVFPLYAGESEMGQPVGKLLGWQARCFNPNYLQKYYKVGEFNEFFHVMNLVNGKGHDLIIVEDYLSAIKIARKHTAMPLFGCDLTPTRMKKLENYAEDLTFWLDEDKADKAYNLAKQATLLGFRSKFIITKHDPKDYNDEQIEDAVATSD